jgi:hypothetical protein
MNSNPEPNTATLGPPVFSWWADQMTHMVKLATSASLYPGMAAMRYLHLFFPEAPAAEAPKAAPEKVEKKANPKPPTELDELKQAMQEFEEKKGDWSKGR